MDDFCGSEFWVSISFIYIKINNMEIFFQNITEIWESESLKIPPCFEQTVLVWTPCAFLWLFTVLEVFYMRNNLSRNIPWNYFNITKLVVNAALIVLTVIDLSKAVGRDDVPDVDIVTPIIKLVTFVSCFQTLVVQAVIETFPSRFYQQYSYSTIGNTESDLQDCCSCSGWLWLCLVFLSASLKSTPRKSETQTHGLTTNTRALWCTSPL